MNRIIILLAAVLMSSAAMAQGTSKIMINIDEPVSFKELMITGASTQPLAIYSSYAADRSATFNFSRATVGTMKNCLYSVICENGKIKGIYLTVQDPAGCRELQSFVLEHFGKPVRELSDKRNGVAESLQYTFDVKGTKASLSVIVDRQANLTMN